MEIQLKLSSMVVVCVLLFGPAIASTNQTKTATVKKKSGQVIMGEIKGLVVLGEARQVDKGSLRGWGAIYFRLKGEDIEAIDEEGVHVRPDSSVSMIIIGQKEKPDHLAVMEMLAAFNDDRKFMAVAEYSSKNNDAFVDVDLRKDKTPIGAKLIGEFSREDQKAKLSPAIDIVTAKGVVTVPVEEIVEFKKTVNKAK